MFSVTADPLHRLVHAYEYVLFQTKIILSTCLESLAVNMEARSFGLMSLWQRALKNWSILLIEGVKYLALKSIEKGEKECSLLNYLIVFHGKVGTQHAMCSF